MVVAVSVSAEATLCCGLLCHFLQTLDLQVKMVSDKMQDNKQKGKAAESDESFQGNSLNQHLLVINMFLLPPFIINKYKLTVEICVIKISYYIVSSLYELRFMNLKCLL